MKLLVLGASGGCGRWVTHIASERGHSVTAVVRGGSESGLSAGAHVVTGSVLDPDFLGPLVDEADAALSCLGLRRRWIIPWSTLLSPPTLVENFSRVVSGLPGAERLTRFVWISAGGVAESRQQASWAVRRMIDAGHVGTAYRDLARAEHVLEESNVRSLAVRPVTLMNGAPTGRGGPVNRYGLLSTIRRSDVATWMVDVADGTTAFEGDRVLLGRR